ncbi:type I restriction-modification system, S subunit [Streptococcus pneumoniae]|nr:type I restriction-modification system, S subunit [Streptococcus pneumoniae]
MTPEQLKASILQRAMEGKLVPQNPNDEPASELLKRIKAEKEKLISEGKIKRDKKETEIFRGDDGKHYGKFADGSTQEIDAPYDIPDTWEWVRIKSIYWNFGQNKPEKSFRYIDTSSIDRKKNIINYKNLQYLSPEQAPSRARKLVSQNSVLFSTVRPYLKNIAVVRELKEYLIASTAFIVLDTLLNETYLKYYLLSDNFINRVNNKSTGTSYPAINDYNFNLLLIAETEIFRGDDGKHYGKFADGSTQEIDVPYDIPDTWEWVRFSTLVEIVRGGSPRPIKDYLTSEVDGINWIKIGDTEKGEKYINNVKEKIKKSGLNKTRFVKKGTFLLTNSMSFGRPYILNVDGAIHDGWLAISNYENSLNKDYLFYILSSNVVYSQFLSLISGAVVKNLNSDKVASILIPLPPLSEQQRIIEAIESALEKVDEYAESYNRLEQLDKEFPDKLKKSILQYAMQGKLVEQDPNDESVEVLLEKIRAEKQKLFEEGKIKKKDLDISIVSQGDDNSYYGNKDETTSYPIYEIPEAWRYIKFASLVNFRIGKTPPRSEATFWGTEIPWVSISDMPISGYVTNTRESISKLALKSKKIDISPKGTLLMSFKLSIGKVAILDIPATHNEAIISIFPYANKENIIRDYLMIFLPLISTLGDSKDAIKGKTLNSTSISELLIPISNHEEMKRIISKVDLLFQKVSQLFE